MKRIWYIIAVLAVLVVVTIVVRGHRAPIALQSPSPTPTPEVTPLPATPTPKTVIRPRASVTPPVPTYAEVAQQYTGRRIQFDVYCQVFPIENTFIDGTDVLLDNRSPDDRVVAIGGVQHGLRGYGWKVVTMTAPELPATLAIDCGTAKNVGKVVIEPLATPTPEPLPSPASSSEPLASASASPSLEPTP
jgi:hypothetical protein